MLMFNDIRDVTAILLLVTFSYPAWSQFQPGLSPAGPTASVGCPERNGRFPVPSQCDAYVECVDGVGEQKLCPDGLLFSTKSSIFSYPCQYPTEVDCEGRSGLQAPQPTADCPHQFGYYREGDANSCGQFKNCANGIGYLFDCPEGLAFNEYSLRCDWPDQVETCNAEAYLGFTCPNAGQQNSLYSPDGYQFFRSPSNCQKYFLCINGRPRLFSCGEGQAFNELTNDCDGVENVTGCAVPSNRQVPFGASSTAPPQFGRPQFGNQFGAPRPQFRTQRDDRYSNIARSTNEQLNTNKQFGPQRLNLFTNNFVDNSFNSE